MTCRIGIHVVSFESDDGMALLQHLREAQEQPLDVILVDIVMPRLGGLEFIRQAMAIWPDIRYVIASGHDDFPYARTALRLGVEDYLMKPVVTEELSTAVRTAWDRAEALRQAREEACQAGIAAWLTRRGSMTLETAALRHLEQALGSHRHLHLTLYGNFYSPPLVRQPTLPGAFSVFLSEAGLHNLAVHLYASPHRHQAILDATPDHTVTIIHTAPVTSADLLPVLVGNGIRIIRDVLVLGRRTVLQMDAGTLAAKQVWSETDGVQQASLDRLRHEYRPEVALDLLRQILDGTAPQRVKERAMGEYMATVHRLDLSTEWLQSFNNSEAFSAACLGLARSSGNAPAVAGGREILRQVLAEMSSRYALHATLQDYADRWGIHPNHLARLFKQELGSTFLEHLTALRMQRARELLAETTGSVADIALAVGYEDSRYFSQVFRRHVDATPSEFRARMRQGACRT